MICLAIIKEDVWRRQFEAFRPVNILQTSVKQVSDSIMLWAVLLPVTLMHKMDRKMKKFLKFGSNN